MSEQAPKNRDTEPSSYVENPAQAEFVAYAESHDREEIIELKKKNAELIEEVIRLKTMLPEDITKKVEDEQRAEQQYKESDRGKMAETLGDNRPSFLATEEKVIQKNNIQLSESLNRVQENQEKINDLTKSVNVVGEAALEAYKYSK